MNTSFEYPILVENSGNFESSVSYTADFAVKDGVLECHHKLTGDSFLTQLLSEGNAKFTTSVVDKHALFRCEVVAEGELQNGVLVQKIPLSKRNRKMYFLGQIVFVDEERKVELDASSGVSKIWQGEEVRLKTGQILAKTSWKESEESLKNLISVEKSKDANLKSFKLHIIPNEGGKILVELNEKLFSDFQNLPLNDKIRKNFENQILTAFFYEFKIKKLENDECEYSNFDDVFERLKEQGFADIKDEAFSCSEAASTFVGLDFARTDSKETR